MAAIICGSGFRKLGGAEQLARHLRPAIVGGIANTFLTTADTGLSLVAEAIR